MTTPTSTTVLKGTSILQVESAPKYWYVGGKIRGQERPESPQQEHSLASPGWKRSACPVCSSSCPLSAALSEPPSRTAHVLVSSLKHLRRVCKATDCRSQSSKMSIYSSFPSLFTPGVESWGERMRNRTNWAIPLQGILPYQLLKNCLARAALRLSLLGGCTGQILSEFD